MIVLNEPEHALVRFYDDSFRWIDVKRFAWDGVGEGESVLDSLLNSPHYRDTYISDDPHLSRSETIHGPYRVAEITPGDFESISPTAARAVVDEFSNLYQSPPAPELLQEIESLVLPRLHGAACYQLRPVENAEHELAGILEEFRELVAISRVAGEVALIVMAID
ncbi:hypothetical protein [Planctomyces sp. SH-PL62]|uniref:hypothetical protein n=1 Tax=Planctomyces sp. SH-PL62 TaxID=1636152 RepID=UPI00078C7D5A|nr:hypothetical protein [Planctomyces sp. SH-PL62]AMV36906.1 hypothetical protein VT85_05710 [Planctomyces sp. SH-PL62]